MFLLPRVCPPKPFCTDERGICPAALDVFVSTLSSLDRGGPLQRFRSYLIKSRRLGAAASKTKVGPHVDLPSLLPAHLLRSPVASVPPKRRAAPLKWRARRVAWSITEWLVSLSGYYDMGSPKSVKDISDRLGPWQTSQQQEDYVFHLFEGMVSFCCLKAETSWSRGRQTLYKAIHTFSNGNSQIGVFIRSDNVVAKYVDPTRVSLPVKAVGLDPTHFLCPQRRRSLRDLSRLVLPECEWPHPLPRPCHMFKPDLEQNLRAKLIQCGLASLIREEEVPSGNSGRKIFAGLFAVPHKAASDRLIIDRRPQNASECGLNWSTLPPGSQLTQIRLKPCQHIRGSGDDLSNYFTF